MITGFGPKPGLAGLFIPGLLTSGVGMITGFGPKPGLAGLFISGLLTSGVGMITGFGPKPGLAGLFIPGLLASGVGIITGFGPKPGLAGLFNSGLPQPQLSHSHGSFSSFSCSCLCVFLGKALSNILVIKYLSFAYPISTVSVFPIVSPSTTIAAQSISLPFSLDPCKLSKSTFQVVCLFVSSALMFPKRTALFSFLLIKYTVYSLGKFRRF